jgi:hypothetical protein
MNLRAGESDGHARLWNYSERQVALFDWMRGTGTAQRQDDAFIVLSLWSYAKGSSAASPHGVTT